MTRIVLFVVSLVLSVSALAADTAPPFELDKWRAWVLDKHADIDCPRLGVQASNRRCAWPGLLRIDVTAGGVSFSQDWQIDGDSWLALPGNQQHWPVAVRVNDASHPVLERNGLPVVRVLAGAHTINGILEWRERPQFLQIPLQSALVRVSIDGQVLGWPNIDDSGRLWFARPDADVAQTEKGDRAKLEVFDASSTAFLSPWTQSCGSLFPASRANYDWVLCCCRAVSQRVFMPTCRHASRMTVACAFRFAPAPGKSG